MNEYTMHYVECTCTVYYFFYQVSVRHPNRRKGSLVHVTPVLRQKTWNIANRLRCNSMGSGCNNVTLG